MTDSVVRRSGREKSSILLPSSYESLWRMRVARLRITDLHSTSLSEHCGFVVDSSSIASTALTPRGYPLCWTVEKQEYDRKPCIECCGLCGIALELLDLEMFHKDTKDSHLDWPFLSILGLTPHTVYNLLSGALSAPLCPSRLSSRFKYFASTVNRNKRNRVKNHFMCNNTRIPLISRIIFLTPNFYDYQTCQSHDFRHLFYDLLKRRQSGQNCCFSLSHSSPRWLLIPRRKKCNMYP